MVEDDGWDEVAPAKKDTRGSDKPLDKQKKKKNKWYKKKTKKIISKPY